MVTKHVAALGTIMLASLAFGLVRGDTGKELATRYAAWDRAYLAQDAEKLESMIDKRFRIVTGSGKVISRSEYVKSLGKGEKPESYATKLLKAKRLSDYKAQAWTEETSKHPGEDAHLHRYRDTWVLVQGHWLLRESRTLGED